MIDFSWIDPTLGYPNDTLVQGVTRVEKSYHVAVCDGAAHKAMEFMKPIHSTDLERLTGKDWELFTVQLSGTLNGKDYVWGQFVEGLGLMHVMVPVENIRELTDAERAAWSKKVLGMFGSHSGKFSYAFPSGVSATKEGQ